MCYLVNEDGLRLYFGFQARLFWSRRVINISNYKRKGSITLAALEIKINMLNRRYKQESVLKELPTWLWLCIQIGCDKVGGEKSNSSVVLSFPPVWITVNGNIKPKSRSN